MNFQNENHNIAGQSDKIVKKSQKHDANLQKNSTLYFQIGLILVLLMVHGLFEMQFETKSPEIAYHAPPNYETFDIAMGDVVVEKDPEIIPEPKAKPPKVKQPTEFDVRDNNEDVKEAGDELFKPVEVPKGADVNVTPDDVEVIPVELPDENIYTVEKVPVFPGCESETTNQGRRDCMSKKLNKFIQKKFNGDLASDLGLERRQRIFVQFKINTEGNIVDIKARAPHDELKIEAQRVIDKLPRMTPGKQGSKPVNVKYTLPIIFSVE